MMNIKYSTELAEIVGLSFGDGSLTKNGKSLRYQLRGNATEDCEHYNEYLIPLFNEKIAIPIAKRKVSVVEAKEPCRSYGFSIQSFLIGSFLNQLGIPIGPKKELNMPSWIKSNRNYLAAFLRGFFDTDRSLYFQKNYSWKPNRHNQVRIKLATTSKELTLELQKALDTFGIKSYMIIQNHKKPRKIAYYVRIDGGLRVNKWFEIIGSKNPKHTTKYLIWRKFKFCPPRITIAQRKEILSGKINPESFYTLARVGERSNLLP